MSTGFRFTRLFALTATLCFAVTSFAVAGEITVTLEFPAPSLTQMGDYTLVEFPDTWNYGDPGHPMLPLRGVQVMLPPGEEVVDATVVSATAEPVDGSFILKPGQPQYPLSFEGPVTPVAPDPAVYELTSGYPANPVDVVSTQFLYGHGIGAISVCPIQYTPSTGEISWFAEMEIRITTTETSRASESLSRLLRQTPHDETRLARLVENPSAMTAYRGITRLPGPGTRGLTTPDEDFGYVIITSSTYESLFQQLADFKSARGIRTTTVLISDIYAEYSGADNQTKIRNFVIDAYNDWGTEHVLLAGDDEIIPHRGLYATAYGYYTDYDIPADLYYGALDGNWNDDGDDRWGEPGEDDLIPEVHMGRAPVDNTTEAQNFLNKTFMYQENPVVADCREAFMLGELLWDDPTWGGDYKDEIMNGASTHGYTTTGFQGSNFHVSRLYDRDHGTWSKFAAIDSLNNGINFCNHLGHAGVTYALRMYNNDVQSYFTNNGVNHGFFIIYSQGCYCGSFDNRNDAGGYGSDAICEYFTTVEEAAVAFVGNSRYGYGEHNSTNGSSQYFDRQFFDAVFGEEIYRIGACNDDSKVDNIPFITYGANRWCYYQLNVMGDPTIDMWTDQPTELTATFPEYLPTVYSEFPVTVTEARGPVEGAQVCLWKEGDVFLVDHTDALGYVLFETEATEAGTLYVTVTKHDWLPFQDTAEVLMGTPPEKPTGLAAESADAQITLTWDANIEPDLTHYVIYRSQEPLPSDSVGVTLAPGTTFVDGSVLNDSTYYYRLRAVDDEGDKSAYSDQISAMPLAPPVIFITHTPLSDTDDSCHPYPVEATITATEAALDPDSVLVVWESFPTRASGVELMTPTGQPDEYSAEIPPQECGSTVQYYIWAVDENGNLETHPDFAPATFHTFHVNLVVLLDDDFEADLGWTVGAADDDATTGIWERCDPNATFEGGTMVQPEDDNSPDPGAMCFVTGNSPPGSGQGINDVDGGKTTLLSPVMDLTGFGTATLSYYRWYTNDTGEAPGSDDWVVDISDDGGLTWVNLETTSTSDRSWSFQSFYIGSYVNLTNQVRVRFVAGDIAPGSIVEAALDDVRIAACPTPGDLEPPTVTVLDPNGGEDLHGRQPYTIQWNAEDNVGVTSVSIFLSRDGGSTFPDTIASPILSGSSYVWDVTDVDCTICRIKVVARDAGANTGFDISDADFTIVEADTVPPVVSLLMPNGGEIFHCNNQYEVTWSASDNRGITRTCVLFSTNSGVAYPETLAAGQLDSTFLWTAPDKDLESCRMRIVCVDEDLNESYDDSDADFRVSSVTDVEADLHDRPGTLVLSQNHPNPFNPATEIQFGLPEETQVSLEVFNIEGRLVTVLANGRYPAGYHCAYWDGRDAMGIPVSSGIYLYRLVTGEKALTKKMLMLK